MQQSLLSIALTGGLLALAPTAEAAVYYDLLDLGTLGGSYSSGSGINDSGQVTGVSFLANGRNHAFLYTNGVMTDLGTLGNSRSGGLAINASGQVTGWYWTNSPTYGHAFLYTNGVMTDLGTLGGSYSVGMGINASGQVTGNSYLAGDIVQDAFLYTNGVMTDLGTLGGSWSAGYAINDSGQVTGFSNAGNGSHAFLYTNGVMADLGTLGGSRSYGYAINASGQVVGESTIDEYNNRVHAFISTNNDMFDLNSLIFSPNITLTAATGINDNGQIVANGTNAQGITHAFLLTPTSTPYVVPIPGAIWLFGSALLGLAGINGRQQATV